MMYTVGMRDHFIANHQLIGEASTYEKSLHAHTYRIELEFTGPQLEDNGYLLDIDVIKNNLEKNLAYFRNSFLNELPEFAGINPSLEHFCRIFCERTLNGLTGVFRRLKVTLWEDDFAWASFEKEL